MICKHLNVINIVLFLFSSDYDMNHASMEPLNSVTDDSAIATDVTVDSITHDVSTIKQKVHNFVHEQTIHQEWIFLAHILNRLCFLIYLFCFSFSIGHHLFS